MSTATEDKQESAPAVKYSVSDHAIAELKVQFQFTNAHTDYEGTRKAISHIVKLRTSIEKRRVELKADALAWGRKVDSEAKRLTEALLEIERPLKVSKDAVDNAAEIARQKALDEQRIKAEAEAKAERNRIEAERQAAIAAENDRLSQEREKLRKEREALEAERKAQEAQRQAEEYRLNIQRRKQEAERQRLEKIEADRLAAIRAEKEKAEAEERKAKAVAEASERARIEAEKAAALLPDAEKLRAWAKLATDSRPPLPMLATEDAKDALAKAVGGIAWHLSKLSVWPN